MRNILTTFDEFIGNEILSDRDIQDYHSAYIDLYNEFRKGVEDAKENINDDLVFEMELIKQVEINIDYVLGLIKNITKTTRKIVSFWLISTKQLTQVLSYATRKTSSTSSFLRSICNLWSMTTGRSLLKGKRLKNSNKSS